MNVDKELRRIRILGMILVGLAVLVVFTTRVHALATAPHLTEMQVFLDFSSVWAGSITVLLFGLALLHIGYSHNDKREKTNS